MTDYENAAVVCFVVLLTRVILSYGYNLLVPISKVDENMKRAQQMDAVKNQKFYFRTNITATCKEDSEPIIKGIGANKLKCSRGFQGSSRGVPGKFQGSSRRFPGGSV